ncbi:VC0807 family protein [Verrucomicrobiaceae bacterium 227]
MSQEVSPAPSATPKTAPTVQKKQDNPLTDIIVNVILPVIILEKCSMNEGKFWHLGPYLAMGLALAIPLAYGIWHFLVRKKVNVFSAVGVGNVVLTGIITIYLYSNADPLVRAKAPLLFGIKEAVQPLILGSLFLITHNRKSPLFNAFIYNDGIFDHPRINKAIAANGKQSELGRLLWTSTLLFFGSFCLSAVMNLGLAYWFLNDLDPAATNWEQLYNHQVGRITKWGFAAIGLPLLIIGGIILARMIKGLKSLTGLETEKILQAR